MKNILVYLYNNMAYWEISILMQLLNHDFKNKVKTITIGDKDELLISSSNVKYKTDILINEINNIEHIDGLIIPGGYYKNDNPLIYNIIEILNKKNKILGAICAAPVILAQSNILNNRKFTTSLNEEYFINNNLNNPFDFSNYINKGIVIDKNIITAKPDFFIEFAVEFCSLLDLFDSEKSKSDTLNWFKGII